MHRNARQTRPNYQMGKAPTKAYRGIRSRIIDGTFKPGEALPERVLCDTTGVSRTPVREALHRLASEGMIHLSVNRTAYVPNIDHHEVDEIFSLATVLGNYAARIAAQKISDAELDELRALADQKDVLLLTDDDDDRSKAFIQLDRSFHTIIVEAVGNHRLTYICSGLMKGPILLWAMARFTRTHFEMSVRFHREVYDALKAHDPDRAEAAMSEFIAVVRDAASLILAPENSSSE